MRVWVASAALMLTPLACSSQNGRFDVPIFASTSGAESETGAQMSDGNADDDAAGSTAEDSMACEAHQDRPIRIAVTVDDQPLMATCNGAAELFQLGRNTSATSDVIEHSLCGSCECSGGPTLTIDLQGTLEVPALPECSWVYLWGRDHDGACLWDGLMLQAGDPNVERPQFIATNARQNPPLASTMGLTAESLCIGVDPCPTGIPGQHALILTEGPLPVSTTPHLDVRLAFGNGAFGFYDVTNRMSSITAQCQERVAWTARLRPEG